MATKETSSRAPNDGQHRPGPGSGAPGERRGQTGIPTPGAWVGTNVGNEDGATRNMRVPTTRKDADLSTTTGSGGPLAPGETGGADDKR